MFKELKMKALKTNLIGIILFFLFGFISIVGEWTTLRTMFNGKADLDELLDDQIHENMYVEGTVWGIYDAYAHTTEDSKVINQEYVIPVGEYGYMGLLVKPEYFDRCDDLIEETWTYLYGETNEITGRFLVKGTILPMDSQSWKYFQQILEEDGWSAEEMEGALPYYLAVDQYGNLGTKEHVEYIIILLVTWGIAFGWLISTLTGSPLKNLKKYCAENGAEARVEQFYRSTTPLHDLRISGEYILGSGGKPCFLLSGDLLWAYTYIEKRKRYYVITVSTSVSVKLCTKDGKQYQHSVSSEEEAKEILEHIHTVLPWVITGYSDELAKTYRKDRQNMIQAVEERKLQSDSAFGL